VAGGVAALEGRPVVAGEAGRDTAGLDATADRLEAQLRDQEARNAALAEELRDLAAAARAGVADAQGAMAEAEARARQGLAAATAQAVLGRIRIAVAAGTPGAGALADLPDGVETPAILTDAAEDGVPALADLQSQFPAAARVALPVAIRETAGDSLADRLGAFLRGQIGGRSIEPRAGDDPDAVLSRAQAAVSAGDLAGALREIGALPAPAQAEMSGWIAAARVRRDAGVALDALAAALDGAN